jgi:hypothetical protein
MSPPKTVERHLSELTECGYALQVNPVYVPNSDLESNIAATGHKQCYTLLLWPNHHEL